MLSFLENGYISANAQVRAPQLRTRIPVLFFKKSWYSNLNKINITIIYK